MGSRHMLFVERISREWPLLQVYRGSDSLGVPGRASPHQ